MKIGIIGAGRMGTAIGNLWSCKGHLVKFSFSRDPQRLQQLAALNANTSAGTIDETVEFGEAILLAVPVDALKEILARPDLFKQKIVITCVSGIEPDFTGDTVGLHSRLDISVAEHIQNTLHVAKVIEAFNMTFSAILEMEDRKVNEKKPVIFYCGDDNESKKIVAGLIEDCDYIAVNAGGLKIARSLETLAAGWIQFAVVAGLFPRIAIHTINY